MATKSPQDVTAKWKNKARQATGDYLAGVDRVTEAPGQKAAEKSEKWLRNVTASQDKWRENVGRVTVSEWRAKTREKGGQRYAPGIEAGESAYADFATQFMPLANQVSEEVAQMADLTLQDSIDRVAHTMRRFSEFRKT